MTVNQRQAFACLIVISAVVSSCVMAAVASAQDDSSARQQYDALLRVYRSGRKDTAAMLSLVQMARDFGEDSVARVVGEDYLDHWIGVRPLDERLAKANIDLASRLMQSSRDSGFALFYRHGKAVDSVIGKRGFAHEMVEGMILSEDIYPRLWHDHVAVTERPDWETIRSEINAEFGRSYADSAILDAQLGWYRRRKDWPNVVKYVVEKNDRYGIDSANPRSVNDWTWNVIFLHSDDRAVLTKAIGWMGVVIRLVPRDAIDIDTYANLLYKTGRVPEALRWEQKATELSDDIEIQANFAKMKRGEPTWARCR